MTKQPTYLILLGPPGCGKGTQAKNFSRLYKWAHVSTGDLLREEIVKNTPLGQHIKKVVDSGKFPTNEEVNQVLEKRLGQADCKLGVIFDGYPRTLPQVEFLEQTLIHQPLVIHIQLSDEAITERVIYRRSCPQCGMTYHLKYHPPKREGLCDYDSSPLMQRKDDTTNVLRQRLAMYDKLTVPLVQYYRSKGLLYEIQTDGMSVDEITEKIRNILQDRIS